MGSLGNGLATSGTANIDVTLSKNLSSVPAPGTKEYLALSNTDHMVTVKWTSSGGWETPQLGPYTDLNIAPAASCLHYATECFEGLKGYRGYDGKLRLFRPDRNGERLAMSSQRASLPVFPPEQLKYLIAKLLQVDGERWLPKEYPGHYLYIRPAMIGTGGKLGYKIPTEAMLFILMTPYRDLSKSSDGTPLGLRLVTSPPDAVRAWPGGFGYAKLGANYGPSLKRHQQASAEGFDQILWLFGPERLVTEAGASNLFVIWDNKETGRRELVTPGLQNKLILSGITRRSVLELANLRFAKTVGSLAPLDVCEKDVSANELEKAWAEGRLLEAFLVGTAYFVTSVSLIKHGETEMHIPADLDGKGYVSQIRHWLDSITYGKEVHDWGFVVQD